MSPGLMLRVKPGFRGRVAGSEPSTSLLLQPVVPTLQSTRQDHLEEAWACGLRGSTPRVSNSRMWVGPENLCF